MLKSYYREGAIEAGCDEAGRGCLAGPVFASAVILPPDFFHKDLNDSKQINEKKREELRTVVEKEAIDFFVARVDAPKIDEINILNASIFAMHLALDGLKKKPNLILVDGNRFKNYSRMEHICVIKGDAKFSSIAAASILAKTYRDDFLKKMHDEFPYFNWQKNKGYPTVEHRNAIREHGTTPYHRMSFKLLPDQLELPF